MDRLVLHQSSPSPSLSEPGAELWPKVSLKRPETSRGRLVRTPNTQLDDGEEIQNQNNLPEGESSWRICKEKDEEAEKGENNLRDRKEEIERERRKADQEVEEERERMMKEKEGRIRLLQEELRGEEEEEERRLREESDERVRLERRVFLYLYLTVYLLLSISSFPV